MKKSLVITLIAAPVLCMSSMAFAGQPAPAQPMQLSAAQMDGVTAGGRMSWQAPSFVYHPVVVNQQLNQVNNSSITILQIGNGNTAFVFNGNLFLKL